MRDRDELDLERTDFDAAAERNGADRDFRRAGLAEPARLGEAGGEARHVDGRAERRPKLRQRADVVLMRVGDDDADEIAS